ncbi:TPA: hypothetical protein RJR39_003567 [Burkholderia cenocepacia]|uniref:hypothetical protein n=1 Tax=Burkholderia cenocepacia TaxID=95486 RepID=UPI001B91A065|nr:hypothetical protein [Burkholderia cenocepacia]MBR8196336.1 hypothetical protein [Burkholderia cenocepacia]HDV6327474.1 hypothetical protein [Burkholderia cenocepacia]HDV6351346.1 hypothetical protein [Burkholderia cenocepacia]
MKKTRVFEPVRLGRKPSRDKRARLASVGTYEVRYDSVVTIKLEGVAGNGTGGAGSCGREPNAVNSFGQPITLPSAGTPEGFR